MKSFLIFIIGIIMLCQCRTDEKPTDFGKSYVNYTLNDTFIYQIDSFRYLPHLGIKDSFTRFEMNLVTEIINNDSNESNCIIDVYTSKDKTNWVFYKKKQLQITNYYELHNQDNIKIIKLSFPIYKNRKWNINLYNTDDPLFAKYSNINATIIQMNGLLEVEIKNEINAIEERIFKEYYAQNRGLVFSNQIDIEILNQKKLGYKVLKKLIDK